MLSENTSQGPDLATRDSRTNTLVAMRSCRAVAPDIAYTSPATYSCLTGDVSSNRKYSSTVIVGSADASRMPHGTLGDSGRATEWWPRGSISCAVMLPLGSMDTRGSRDCQTAPLWLRWRGRAVESGLPVSRSLRPSSQHMSIDRGPIPNSYVLHDGRLIAGEYPGDRRDDPAKATLGALLDAGVRTFIDLTESHELAPYDSLLAAEAKVRGAEARHVRLPIRDVSVPRSAEVMREILDAIDAGLRDGGKVYVHCWGGVGRTGTVVGCHLVRSGLSGDEALARVATLFKSMEKSSRRSRSPETDEQEAYVRSWKESHAKPADGQRDPSSTTSSSPQRDRVRGALIGLAVGDAVGTTVEFKAPGTFAPVTDMVGGGPFGLRPGQWTDDTSMALCLAERLIECGGFDARDQMERYVRWWREGHLSSTGKCFDIGNTTRAALSRFEKTGDPFAGSTEPNAAGNGSLM